MNSVSRAGETPRRFCRLARLALRLIVCGPLCLAAAGCSTWQAPTLTDSEDLRTRAVSQTTRGVRVSATVLGREDSRRLFGVDINATGVQPVWIEVENTTQDMLWLLRSGTDPDYFSPLEVAWSFHAAFSSNTNAMLDDHFRAMAIHNPIPPKTRVSGILFTNPQRQTKFLAVDILGEEKAFAFSLFPPVPGEGPDERLIESIMRHVDADAEDYQDDDALRARLEAMPCCAVSADGNTPGDPLNVVIVGKFPDIASALVRRGYRRQELKFDTSQRLFGRAPDIVARKTGQGGVPANWLRFWVAPFRYRGQLVFMVQAGRPVGGRFRAAGSDNLRLHANIDESRDILLQDMLYSGGLERLGFTRGVGAANADNPRTSIGGTRYFTDGLRSVMFFATRPRTVSNVEILDWVKYAQRDNPVAQTGSADAGN